MTTDFRKNDVVISHKNATKEKLVLNKVKCLECNTILESTHVHDYKTCDCPNQTMVDGGLEYARWGGKDLNKVSLMHEYVAADFFLWGVLDLKTGYVHKKPLADLTDSHIQNIVLHLRTRYQKRPSKFLNDPHTLYNHLLPELMRRGLDEVKTEVPHNTEK